MKNLQTFVRTHFSLLTVLLLPMLLMVLMVTCFAQGTTGTVAEPANIWTTIANILQPLLGFGAVRVFKNWIAPNVSGIVVVSIIVPIASALIAGITSLLGIAGTSFILQFVLGLLSNFISQIVIQVQKAPA